MILYLALTKITLSVFNIIMRITMSETRLHMKTIEYLEILIDLREKYPI
jgi:hypothetical protein